MLVHGVSPISRRWPAGSAWAAVAAAMEAALFGGHVFFRVFCRSPPSRGFLTDGACPGFRRGVRGDGYDGDGQGSQFWGVWGASPSGVRSPAKKISRFEGPKRAFSRLPKVDFLLWKSCKTVSQRKPNLRNPASASRPVGLLQSSALPVALAMWLLLLPAC